MGVSAAANSLNIGCRVLAAVDIDARALQVYNHNLLPVSTINLSVNDLIQFSLNWSAGDWEFSAMPKLVPPLLEHAGTVDLVIGGPPCQGHSGFNNKSRGSDARNSLYLSAVATAIALEARAIVLENVPEIVRSSLAVVDIAKKLLRSSGYSVDDHVLASHEIGWPQSRRRHFLVASKGNLVPLSDVSAEYAAAAPGAATFLSSLPARGGTMDEVPEYSKQTRERLQFFEDHPEEYNLPLSARPECHREGTTYTSVYGRMRPNDPVPTLTSGFMTPGRGRFIHPTLTRTLTASEAAFVQGFPSWYDFEPTPAGRSELQKWIGDAVPLPLGYVAAQAVLRGLWS